MSRKVVHACELKRNDPPLRRRVHAAWKDRGGLPKDADLIGPADWDIPGLFGAYWASLDWLDPEGGFDYGQDPKARFLRALNFLVVGGENASFNAAARAARVKDGTVRSWLSRDDELHERAVRILQDFDYSALWPEEWLVRDLDRLACLPLVEQDIAALRRGMGPRKDFIDVAHRNKLPEDTLERPQ